MKKSFIFVLALALALMILGPGAHAAPAVPQLVINGHVIPAVRGNSGNPALVMVGDTAYIDLLDLGNLRGVIAADDEKGARIGVYDDAMNYCWVALITKNDQPGPEPAAFTRGGKIYVPLRRWAEFLGVTVMYDGEKIIVQQ